MAKFVLLYTGGSGMPETEAQKAELMQAWGTWYGTLGSGVVDGGNPFAPQVKSIAANGAVSTVPNGAQATGYSIISGDSMDAAVGLAQGCPILAAGGQIAVCEIVEM